MPVPFDGNNFKFLSFGFVVTLGGIVGATPKIKHQWHRYIFKQRLKAITPSFSLGDSHAKEAGMLVISFRVFGAERYCLYPQGIL